MGWEVIDLDDGREVVVMLTVNGRKLSFTHAQLVEILERKVHSEDLREAKAADRSGHHSLSSLSALTRELKRRIEQEVDTAASEQKLFRALASAGQVDRPARATAQLGLMLEDCFNHVGDDLKDEIKKFLRVNSWLIDEIATPRKKSGVK
jgi:hypothetical protein